jgi:ribosomal protein L37AE/L43A
MSRTNIKFKIVCPKCGKEHRGKPIALGYVKQCKCGYTFTHQEIKSSIERVRQLRKDASDKQKE